MTSAVPFGESAPIDPGRSSRLGQALKLEAIAARRYLAQTDAVYWNLTGPFGGWLFALGAKAILIDADVLGEPVEAHGRFLAAPQAGTLELRVERQSQGRNVAFWRTQIWQAKQGQERLCAEVSLLLAKRRQSLDVLAVEPPEVTSWQHLTPLRLGQLLPWLDLFDLRYVKGRPFEDPPSGTMQSIMWVRERESRPLDWPALLVLADIAAPRTFLLQRSREPTATLAMSVYFMVDAQELAVTTDDWLLFEIDGHAARRGFFDHHVRIWRGRQLLATSTQLAFFT